MSLSHSLIENWDLKKDQALRAMITKAREMGIFKGVAAVLLVDDAELHNLDVRYLINETFERDPDPAKPDDGVNYFGVVSMKIGQMLSTRADSGKLPRPAKIGEVTYPGGLIKRILGGYLCVAYSGGTPDEDVIISHVGIDILDS